MLSLGMISVIVQLLHVAVLILLTSKKTDIETNKLEFPLHIY